MKDLEGAWTLNLPNQSQQARARVDGQELVIEFRHGPVVRLGQDLRGTWSWGARSSEQKVRFQRKDDGSLSGWVGKENWILTRE
jgi:hypothetical protein